MNKQAYMLLLCILLPAASLYPQVNVSTQTFSTEEKNTMRQAKVINEAEALYRQAISVVTVTQAFAANIAQRGIDNRKIANNFSGRLKSSCLAF